MEYFFTIIISLIRIESANINDAFKGISSELDSQQLLLIPSTNTCSNKARHYYHKELGKSYVHSLKLWLMLMTFNYLRKLLIWIMSCSFSCV